MGINFSKVNFSYYIPKKKQNIKYTLHDINLNINKTGEFIALVGHTGSGKSTLSQLMNALLMPTTGNLNILGYNVNQKIKLKPIRKKVGLVFQFPEYQIFEDTVLKDILFGPQNFGLDNPEKRAKDAAEVMGITDLLDRSPFTLSGGQLRKVAISGILASDPEVLILDEPTVGLDPFTKDELLKFLKILNEEYGKTIIIITHDMEVVSKYIKRVVVMDHGHIIYDGSKEDLFEQDNLMEKYNLDYPATISLLRRLKDHFKVDMNVNQHSIEAAYQEIVRVFGENHE